MEPKLTDLIGALAGSDDELAGKAREQIKEWQAAGRIKEADVVALMEAATGELAPHPNELIDPAATLVYAARDMAARLPGDREEILAAVKRLFADLPTPRARGAALSICTQIVKVQSARVYCDLLLANPDGLDDGGLPVFSGKDYGYGSFGKPATSEMASELFPALLGVAGVPGFEFGVNLMLLDFLQAGILSPEDLAGHEAGFVSRLEKVVAGIKKHQERDEPGHLNWKYEEPYASVRNIAGVLMDVAGVWPAPAVLDLLEGAEGLTDPRMRFFRAMSLLRGGRDVAQDELEWIARHPRERYWMHQKMIEMGLGDRLPEACRDQAALAEGNMVDWLCYGTELAREPDEIELLCVETRVEDDDDDDDDDGDGEETEYEYYFFRFRVNEEYWAKENGWMVGMAGGYPRVAGGTTSHNGGTFSTFGSFEEKSLAEHVAGYIE